jgi:hypothetical protein
MIKIYKKDTSNSHCYVESKQWHSPTGTYSSRRDDGWREHGMDVAN